MFEYILTMVYRDGDAGQYKRKSREEVQILWAKNWTEFVTYGQISKINTLKDRLIVEVECTSGPTKPENFQ